MTKTEDEQARARLRILHEAEEAFGAIREASQTALLMGCSVPHTPGEIVEMLHHTVDLRKDVIIEFVRANRFEEAEMALGQVKHLAALVDEIEGV